MGTVEPQARLEQLEAAIRRHREEKSTVPDCTCWVSQAQTLDAALYGCLAQAGSVEARVAHLEEAIRVNRHGKKDVPNCPCWGNAPQRVDAELFAVLDDADRMKAAAA
jgi:hypothetical protein